MDQKPSGYIHIVEQKHAKLSYDGIVMNESDAPLCGRRHLWLEPTKLRCCLVLQRSTSRRTRIAMERRVQIGLERDRNSFSETQPRTCWVICTTVHTDERAPLNPTTVDPSRTSDEGEDEDERGDETSEPAQTENRKAKMSFRRRNQQNSCGHRYLQLVRRTRVH